MQKSYMYPVNIPPNNTNKTYNAIARFLRKVESPAITHALVAEPVIINAIIAPSLDPEAINVCIIGAADSVVIYNGKPISEANGTEKKLLLPNNREIIDDGTKWFIRKPTPTKIEKYSRICFNPRLTNSLPNS